RRRCATLATRRKHAAGDRSRAEGCRKADRLALSRYALSRPVSLSRSGNRNSNAGSRAHAWNWEAPMNVMGVSPYPFDTGFYEALGAKRATFKLVSDHIVPARSGYGWRVKAGQAFRIVMVEGGQVVDLCIFSADDPHEHYSAGTQFYTEGARVTRHT